jgi:hypothetical protein
MPLVLSASRPSAALLAPMEASLTALDVANVDRDEALEVWTTLVALATGYASYQLGGHMRGESTATVDPEARPRVAAVAGARLDGDRAFQRAVDRQLAALEVS